MRIIRIFTQCDNLPQQHPVRPATRKKRQSRHQVKYFALKTFCQGQDMMLLTVHCLKFLTISRLKKDIIWVETDKGFWLRICEQNLRFTRLQSSEFNSEQVVNEITKWLKNKWDTSYISSTWWARDTMRSLVDPVMDLHVTFCGSYSLKYWLYRHPTKW